MRYRQHTKGRATVHYVESAFAHRTVDKGSGAFSGAQAHLDYGGAEVRRGARHGQAGAENENSTDGLSMPLELLLKGLDVSHVDIVLRLPLSRGRSRRGSSGFECSDNLIEAPLVGL
jgi:hypothetical protein